MLQGQGMWKGPRIGNFPYGTPTPTAHDTIDLISTKGQS
jgi:hypothetical protein